MAHHLRARSHSDLRCVGVAVASPSRGWGCGRVVIQLRLLLGCIRAQRAFSRADFRVLVARPCIVRRLRRYMRRDRMDEEHHYLAPARRHRACSPARPTQRSFNLHVVPVARGSPPALESAEVHPLLPTPLSFKNIRLSTSPRRPDRRRHPAQLAIASSQHMCVRACAGGQHLVLPCERVGLAGTWTTGRR